MIASGRMAVFLGSELGWDHEGDLDVLGAFYRLGLRTIQFATQTGFNAFADREIAMQQGGQKPDHFHGLNDRGRALVAEMNRLGILIDITHGTEAAQKQMIEASKAPVVAATAPSRRCRASACRTRCSAAREQGRRGRHPWRRGGGRQALPAMDGRPSRRDEEGRQALPNMLGYQPSQPRRPATTASTSRCSTASSASAWRARGGWKEIPALEPLIPTADEWAEHVDYAIKLVGADHVAIGLDMAGGRSGVPRDAGGYGEILAALRRITTPANVTKICGENWFRVLDSAKA